MVAAGCSDSDRASQGPGPAAYGPPAGEPPAVIARARPNEARPSGWSEAPFFLLQTELSPATLFHSSSNYLGCFSGMTDAGPGGPTFAAYASKTGIRIAKQGEPMEAAMMDECWVLVWFSGAKGWTNFDSPWAVFLQRKPVAMKLDEEGLRFEFAAGAGDVVLLPLYGYLKLPVEGGETAGGRAAASKSKLKTWQWGKAVPKEPLMRARYWASVSREFPVYCEDSFSVDRGRDSVTIRQRFEWRAIEDDWNTPHLKLAPVSPPLALAAQDKKFPVTLSRPVSDLDFFTPYGPYVGVEGKDTFEATFHVLRYVNETELPVTDATNTSSAVSGAVKQLRALAREAVGHEPVSQAMPGDQWVAKALPYLDEPTRVAALARLRKYFRDDVLVTNRFRLRESPEGSGRTYWDLVGFGNGSGERVGDAEKGSAKLLETLWAYAHFSGDWELIREGWPLVKRLSANLAETSWAAFAREGVAELGEGAAPCLALARMAYRAGDLDAYDYACYLFARELVHHQVKQTGADYFRKHQPWHSMEAMKGEVYLTRVLGEGAGWQIDGPRYPNTPRERCFQDRWVRFQDADVGRFYRDHLSVEVREELELWERLRGGATSGWYRDSNRTPSVVQLRSLLLNETPDELAKQVADGRFSEPTSGMLGSSLALIRTSEPMRYQRLIPVGSPSPFVTGVEREVAGPNVFLVQSVLPTSSPSVPPALRWPRITWSEWKTPMGAPWTFGEVRPVRSGVPAGLRRFPLNWNSEVVVYRAADGISP